MGSFYTVETTLWLLEFPVTISPLHLLGAFWWLKCFVLYLSCSFSKFLASAVLKQVLCLRHSGYTDTSLPWRSSEPSDDISRHVKMDLRQKTRRNWSSGPLRTVTEIPTWKGFPEQGHKLRSEAWGGRSQGRGNREPQICGECTVNRRYWKKTGVTGPEGSETRSCGTL